jgi:hypothetical protein
MFIMEELVGYRCAHDDEIWGTVFIFSSDSFFTLFCGVEALCMLGNHSTPELYPQISAHIFYQTTTLKVSELSHPQKDKYCIISNENKDRLKND